MPRITAEEARALGETTVVQLVGQAWERIRAAAPHRKSVMLTRADHMTWGTFNEEARKKLEEVADILRADGFEVTYYFSGPGPGSEAGTVIDWSVLNDWSVLK